MNSEVIDIKKSDLFNSLEGHLWIGSTPAAQPGSHAMFTFIVNLYPWEQYPMSEHQVMLMAPLLDSDQMPNEDVLNMLAEYVNMARRVGPTLVHCQAGRNRSALICALALVRSGSTPEDAIALIRSKHDPLALSNKTFESWLLNLARPRVLQ